MDPESNLAETQIDPEVKSSETTCLICHHAITPGQDVFLPCAHRYHMYCMEAYGDAQGCSWQQLPCPACKSVPAHHGDDSIAGLNMNAAAAGEGDPEIEMILDDHLSTTMPSDEDLEMNLDDDIDIPRAAPKADAKAKAKSKAKAKAKAKATSPTDNAIDSTIPAPKAEAKAKAKASAKAKAKAKAKAQHAMIPPVHPTMYGATFAYG